MEEKWSQEDILKAVRMVSEKAATDHKFKQLALKDPGTALRQVMGRELPATTKFLLIEEGDSGIVSTIGDGPLETKPVSEMICAAIRGRCPCGRTNVLTVPPGGNA